MSQLVPLSGRDDPSNGQALAERQPLGSLATALASARDKCRVAVKSSYNAFHKYQYASADEIVATAAAALAGSGLGLIPLREEMVVSGSGNLTFYALNRALLLAHSSGESVILETRGWPVVPDRGRPLDKAYSIALTSSLAYKLRDLLQMPRGDGSDDVAAQKDAAASVPVALAESQPEVATANPSEAPQAEERLTEPEVRELVALARANKRTQSEVSAMLGALGVRRLENAPRAKQEWLRQALTTGLVSTTLAGRIAAQVEQLQLPWPAVGDKLRQRYGVTSVGHLLPAQADEVLAKLEAQTAKLQSA